MVSRHGVLVAFFSSLHVLIATIIYTYNTLSHIYEPYIKHLETNDVDITCGCIIPNG